MMNALKYRKREVLMVIFIFLFAIITTKYIYDKFNGSSNVDYNTDTLDVTFHEKSGADVNILKVTPVTDSVGLSSKAYKFTIKNNTNSSIKYSINLKQNDELIKKDNCLESQIPTNIVRFSIHKNDEKNNIYTVSDLVNGHILSRIIKANKSEEYTMRFWTVNNNAIPTGAKLHYHSTIDVVDEGVEIAAVVK